MTEHEEVTIHLAAEAGAEFLDDVLPGWWWDVDPDRLAMDTPILGTVGGCGCVGAQLGGVGVWWDDFVRSCVLDGYAHANRVWPEAVALGFTLASFRDRVSERWDYLTRCWVAEINARRYDDLSRAKR